MSILAPSRLFAVLFVLLALSAAPLHADYTFFVTDGEGEDGGCVVHNPNYDFNDQAIVYGASYWAEIAEKSLPRKPLARASDRLSRATAPMGMGTWA